MTDLLAEIETIKRVHAAIPKDDYNGDSFDIVHQVKDRMYAMVDSVKEDPALLTPAVLDGFAGIAANSPFRDIHDPDAEIHHRQTSAQDICLNAVRIFDDLAQAAPGMTGQVVDRLEALVRDNLDYDIRREALMDLWMLTMWEGAAQEPAFAALERQGKTNDCHEIRTQCRDNLLQTAKEHPDLAPRAWQAQIDGAGDPDTEARTRALALLTNRVKEADCSYDEAENLMTLFRKAAAKAGAEEATVQYWAQQGVGDIQTRRMKELVERGCSTVDDVQPIKPFKLKLPGR